MFAISLAVIADRIGFNHSLYVGPGYSVRRTHRYRAGDTIQGKDGREYYIILPVWRKFRWHPLVPCYLVNTNDPLGRIIEDCDFW